MHRDQRCNKGLKIEEVSKYPFSPRRVKFKTKIELKDKCFANCMKYISGRKKKAANEHAVNTISKAGSNLFILLK